MPAERGYWSTICMLSCDIQVFQQCEQIAFLKVQNVHVKNAKEHAFILCYKKPNGAVASLEFSLITV